MLLQFLLDFVEALCLKMKTIHLSLETPKKKGLTVKNSTSSLSVSHNTGKNIDI